MAAFRKKFIMRLDEFESPGVFVALKIDSASANVLAKFVETELQLKPLPPKEMHVTIAGFKKGFVDETTFPKLDLPIEIDVVGPGSQRFGFFNIPHKGIKNGVYIVLEKNSSLIIARNQILDWFHENGIETKSSGGHRRERWKHSRWIPHVSITFQNPEEIKIPFDDGKNEIKVKTLLQGHIEPPLTSLSVTDVILSPHIKTWGMDLLESSEENKCLN